MSKFNHQRAKEDAGLAHEIVRGDWRARVGHAPRSCALFTLMFLCGFLVRTEGQTVGGFTNRYGAYGTNFISIAPWTAQGIFYEGDTVTISNRLRTTIEVYDYHFNPITNARSPAVLSHLGLGHYFVQVNGIKKGQGDRAQFIVLPRGYTNHPHADIGEQGVETIAGSNRFARIAPGFSRLQLWWGPTSTVTEVGGIVNDSGTYNWTPFDQMLRSYSNVPVKVMNIIVSHTTTNGWYAPMVDKTNSVGSWVTDVALLYSNAAARFGTSFIYEILNEPSEANIDFDTKLNPSIAMDRVGLPAAMAVSAAVQAVQFVCPSCQTWAPGLPGLNAGWICLVTNSDLAPYYAGASAISFHYGDTVYGPVDVIQAYTNVLAWNSATLAAWYPPYTYDKIATGLYPGKLLAITECYPFSPDPLGQTNNWWVEWPFASNTVPLASWTWREMTTRFWKNIVAWKASGVTRVQMWQALADAHISPKHPPVAGKNPSDFSGWESENGDIYDRRGGGPKPIVDGQAMLSWWLNGAVPIANWLSGGWLTLVNPEGSFSSGTPGLHFFEWQFADGSTNTIVWADEGTTITTNFGVGLTDIYSNAWTGPIGEEPVVAWGWPNNNLGGSFSIQPMAAFGATPTRGSVPLTVTFTDVSAGAITNHFWQFGDGFVTNAPGLTVVHRYMTPATNTIQLIVSGPTGVSTTTQSIIVTTFPPPLTGGGINGFPPVFGGTSGGDAGGTHSTQPNDVGGANSSWRIMMTY